MWGLWNFQTNQSRFWTHRSLFVDYVDIQSSMCPSVWLDSCCICIYVCVPVHSVIATVMFIPNPMPFFLHRNQATIFTLFSHRLQINRISKTKNLFIANWSFSILASSILFGVNSTWEFDFFFHNSQIRTRLPNTYNQNNNFIMQLSVTPINFLH